MVRTVEQEIRELFAESINSTSKDEREFRLRMHKFAGDALDYSEELTLQGETAMAQRAKAGYKIAKTIAESGLIEK